MVYIPYIPWGFHVRDCLSYWMQACEGCGLPTANVSEECLFQLAACVFISIILRWRSCLASGS
ncbi:hypothetical protein DPMN_193862 [Dreissena polymorpha]|uniref:Uncharacterized protein n=1 Tax=Dreissena polymorpha TaxID=45954 RepID=A0A9D4BGH4_DREPO|nr:hypothetical protein DPMN_193862 [Dreissena polymorpha]